jgi:hypothetical protein
MRSLTNFLRIAVLTACAIWLITRAPTVHAQLQNCPKLNTEKGVEVCNSCCSSQPSVSNWTDGTSEGAGTQTLETMYANCGSSTNSCPRGTQYTGCGSQPWYEAVDDASCCLPSSTPCNQGTCCSGLVCLSSGSCGTCYQNGTSCSLNSDCCAGTCQGHKCGQCGNLCGNACLDGQTCPNGQPYQCQGARRLIVPLARS